MISGHARFARPGVVDVAGRRLRYRKAIIATGSRPRVPSIPGLAQADPLTSETVWDLDQQPRSLAVLGTQVALIEAGDPA